MDGREFIRNSNEMVWNDPFPPWTPAVGTRQLEREARERRRQRAAEPKPESSQTSSLPHPSSLVTTPNTTASPSIPAKAQPESKGRTQLVQHYIMNLPDSAITFLNAFIGLLTPLFSDPLFTSMSKEGKVEMPMIHVYCFTRFTERDAAQLDICQVSLSLMSGPQLARTGVGKENRIRRSMVVVKADMCRELLIRSNILSSRICKGIIFTLSDLSRRIRTCTV